MTTPTTPAIPADVQADTREGAPVDPRILAHSRRIATRRQATGPLGLRPLVPPPPTAAPMLAGHLLAGDVIRHPDVAGGFLRITVREDDGALFGYAIHHVTGYLDGRVVPVRLPADAVVAVWAV